jgi:hypothetical protein
VTVIAVNRLMHTNILQIILFNTAITMHCTIYYTILSQDKLANSTPTSQLHPSITHAQSLVRWTGKRLHFRALHITALHCSCVVTQCYCCCCISSDMRVTLSTIPVAATTNVNLISCSLLSATVFSVHCYASRSSCSQDSGAHC